MKASFRWFRVAASLLSVAVLGICLVASVNSRVSADNETVTQTYDSDGNLQQGMMVRLADGSKTKVVALGIEKASAMQGLVVSSSDSTLALSGGAISQHAVYVATYGRYSVLVTDQNGEIKSGDYITVSSLDGVGMKANRQQSVVLGRSLDAFTGSNNVIGTATLKTGDGKTKQVSLGRVNVDIGIGHNPLFSEDDSSGGIGFLKNFSSGIAGKQVGPLRLYIALAILLACSFVAGSVLYSGVRSAIGSIGRNPLAKKSIMRGLLQVVLTSLVTFVLGLFGVYLLLKF
jgi:hypothetical protein